MRPLLLRRRGGGALVAPHHEVRVVGAAGDDPAPFAALLVVLTEQDVADVVGRGGSVGRGDHPTIVGNLLDGVRHRC